MKKTINIITLSTHNFETLTEWFDEVYHYLKILYHQDCYSFEILPSGNQFFTHYQILVYKDMNKAEVSQAKVDFTYIPTPQVSIEDDEDKDKYISVLIRSLHDMRK